VEVIFRTEADGLLGSIVRCTRYQGRYDPETYEPGVHEDRKKSRDMATYDYPTMIGIQARFAARTYKATNDRKYAVDPRERKKQSGAHRLPPNTVFAALVRVGKNGDGHIRTGIRAVWQRVKAKKTGNVSYLALETSDPAARMIKSAARFLPQAFKNVQAPPALARRRKDETVDE
jgi:hypothetical protein